MWDWLRLRLTCAREEIWFSKSAFNGYWRRQRTTRPLKPDEIAALDRAFKAFDQAFDELDRVFGRFH